MITIADLMQKKHRGQKITMLTAYDYPLARLIESAGLDMILVGDSGGMVKLGYKTTIPVTMSEMLMMVKAVRRGAPDTFLIADLPFLSYQVSKEQAVLNAGRLIKYGGADAVKLEGGSRMASVVRAISDAGIAVQGHIGLTPQNLTQLSGFRAQGMTVPSARSLLDDARALEKAGIFSLILEAVPVVLADYLTKRLSIPTIGTGAGAGCDGQNLITPDVIGFFDRFKPRFAKRYANISEVILGAINTYKNDVLTGQFPGQEHTYALPEENGLDDLLASYDWDG